MNFASVMSTLHRAPRSPWALTLACLAALALSSAAAASQSGLEGTPSKPPAAATLQQCLTTGTQSERSATFAGEMSAIPGTARMQMRIEVLERMPADLAYHTVSAPGVGAWSSSSPGVKVYKNLNKVTNLAAPAFYRAAVRFRWVNAKGKLLKVTELRTRRCEQPAPSLTETETPPTGGAGSAAQG